MNSLAEIGFKQAGHWQLIEGKLTCKLDQYSTATNVLYAFVCDGEVKYVGKTVRPLSRRMYGYQNPSVSQSTNFELNKLISERLQAQSAVDIFVLPDNGLLHYGKFHVNLAAGLEDSVIKTLKPAWNGAYRKRSPDDADEVDDADEGDDGSGLPAVTHSFEFTLQPTYFRTGFFNVPVAATEWLGNDGQEIEIFCGDGTQPITGIINRTANTNKTPRVIGGAQLRDWLQANFALMDTVRIQIHSPVSIRVSKPSE